MSRENFSKEGRSPFDAREKPTLIQVEFQPSRDGSMAGSVVKGSPLPSEVENRLDTKICFVAREYRGAQPRQGETWIARFLRDTKPGERKGAWLIEPVEKVLERFEIVDDQYASGRTIDGRKFKHLKCTLGLITVPDWSGKVPEKVQNELDSENSEVKKLIDAFKESAGLLLPSAAEISLIGDNTQKIQVNGRDYYAKLRIQFSEKGIELDRWEVTGQDTSIDIERDAENSLISSAIIREAGSNERVSDWKEAQRIFGAPVKVVAKNAGWEVEWNGLSGRIGSVIAWLPEETIKESGAEFELVKDNLSWKGNHLYTPVLYPNLPPILMRVGTKEKVFEADRDYKNPSAGYEVKFRPAHIEQNCPEEIADAVRQKLAESLSIDSRDSEMQQVAEKAWGGIVIDIGSWQRVRSVLKDIKPESTQIIQAHWTESINFRDREEGGARWIDHYADIITGDELPEVKKKNRYGVPIVNYDAVQNQRAIIDEHSLPVTCDVEKIAELKGKQLYETLSDEAKSRADLKRLESPIVVQAVWDGTPDPRVYSEEEISKRMVSRGVAFEDRYAQKDWLESIRYYDKDYKERLETQKSVDRFGTTGAEWLGTLKRLSDGIRACRSADYFRGMPFSMYEKYGKLLSKLNDAEHDIKHGIDPRRDEAGYKYMEDLERFLEEIDNARPAAEQLHAREVAGEILLRFGELEHYEYPEETRKDNRWVIGTDGTIRKPDREYGVWDIVESDELAVSRVVGTQKVFNYLVTDHVPRSGVTAAQREAIAKLEGVVLEDGKRRSRDHWEMKDGARSGVDTNVLESDARRLLKEYGVNVSEEQDVVVNMFGRDDGRLFEKKMPQDAINRLNSLRTLDREKGGSWSQEQVWEIVRRVSSEGGMLEVLRQYYVDRDSGSLQFKNFSMRWKQIPDGAKIEGLEVPEKASAGLAAKEKKEEPARAIPETWQKPATQSKHPKMKSEPVPAPREQIEIKPLSHSELLDAQRKIGSARLVARYALLLSEKVPSRVKAQFESRHVKWLKREEEAMKELEGEVDRQRDKDLRQLAQQLAGDAKSMALEAARSANETFRENWADLMLQSIAAIAVVETELNIDLNSGQKLAIEDRMMRSVQKTGRALTSNEVFDIVVDITA